MKYKATSKATSGSKSVVGKKQLIKKIMKSRLALFLAMTAFLAFFVYEVDNPMFRNWAVIIYAVVLFIIILDLCGKTDDVQNEDIEIVDAFVVNKEADSSDDSISYYLTLLYCDEPDEKKISVGKGDFDDVDESEKCFIIKNEDKVLGYYSQKRFSLDEELRKLYRPSASDVFEKKKAECERRRIQEEKEFEEWIEENARIEIEEYEKKKNRKKAKQNGFLKKENTDAVYSAPENCEHDFAKPESCSHDFYGYDKETNVIHATNPEQKPERTVVVFRIIRNVVLWAIVLLSLLCAVVGFSEINKNIPFASMFGCFAVISLLMIFTKLKNFAFLYITAFFAICSWESFLDVDGKVGAIILAVMALLAALPAIFGNVARKRK